MPSPALTSFGLPFVGAANTPAPAAMADSSSPGGFAQMLNQAQRSPQPTPVPAPRTPSPQPAKPAPSPQTQKTGQPEPKGDADGDKALERQRHDRALQQRSAATERPGKSAPVNPGPLNPAAPRAPIDELAPVDPVECPIDEQAEAAAGAGADLAAVLNPLQPPKPAEPAAAQPAGRGTADDADTAKLSLPGSARPTDMAGTAATDASGASRGAAAAKPGGEETARSESHEFATQLQAATEQGAGPPSKQEGAGPLGSGAVVAQAVAPAGPGASVASGSVAEGRMHAAPGSAEFPQELGLQISTFVRDGVHHAKLELNPADMGPVTVQIQLDGQAAQVNLSAENADTRRALEQAMPQLAGSLREAGLTLSGGGVSEQPRQPPGEPSASDAGTRGGRGGQDGDPLYTEERTAHPPPARRRGVVDLVA